MLLKIALLVAVEFHVNVEFVKLLEPPENQENDGEWQPTYRPSLTVAVCPLNSINIGLVPINPSSLLLPANH